MAGQLAALYLSLIQPCSGIIVLMGCAARAFLTQNRATLIFIIAFHNAFVFEAWGSGFKYIPLHLIIQFHYLSAVLETLTKRCPEIQHIVCLLRWAVNICSPTGPH